jgi:predicted nucleic acid-binding protein
VEFGLLRAAKLDTQYRDLGLRLVDGVVAAVAERLRASGIATLDVRHFGALELAGGRSCIRGTCDQGTRGG